MKRVAGDLNLREWCLVAPSMRATTISGSASMTISDANVWRGMWNDADGDHLRCTAGSAARFDVMRLAGRWHGEGRQRRIRASADEPFRSRRAVVGITLRKAELRRHSLHDHAPENRLRTTTEAPSCPPTGTR